MALLVRPARGQRSYVSLLDNRHTVDNEGFSLSSLSPTPNLPFLSPGLKAGTRVLNRHQVVAAAPPAPSASPMEGSDRASAVHIQARLDATFGAGAFRVQSAVWRRSKLRQLTVTLKHAGIDPFVVYGSAIGPPDEESKVELQLGRARLQWRIAFWNIVPNESWITSVGEDVARVDYDGWEETFIYRGNSHLPIFITRECFEKSEHLQRLEDVWQVVALCLADLKLSVGRHQQGWLLLDKLYDHGHEQCRDLSIPIGSHVVRTVRRLSVEDRRPASQQLPQVGSGEDPFDFGEDADPSTLVPQGSHLTLNSPGDDSDTRLPQISPRRTSGISITGSDILADVPSYHERWTIAEIIKNNAQEGDVTLTPNRHNIDQLADAIRLNVSICTLRLRCRSDLLAVDDCLAKVWFAFSLNESIRTLDLQGQGMTAVGMEWLCKGLTMAKNLTILNLSRNKVGDEGARFLADMLKHSLYLTSLDASRNCIGEAGGLRIASAFGTNHALRHLDLSHNLLRDDVLQQLTRTLTDSNTSLQRLCLQNVDLGPQGAYAMGQLLSTSTSIQELDLEDNPRGDPSSLALHLEHNATLNSLAVDSRGGNPQKLLRALSRNTGLTHLKLTFTTLDESTAVTLAMALRRNRTLQTLLWPTDPDHQTHPTLLSDVLGALKANTSLRRLSLAGHQLGDCIGTLQDALQSCPVEWLDLSCTYLHIHPNSLDALADMLRENQRVTYLDLSLNLFEDRICALIPALESNCTLVNLNLSYTGVGNDALRSVAESLVHNIRLQTLGTLGIAQPRHPLTHQAVLKAVDPRRAGGDCPHHSTQWRIGSDSSEIRDFRELVCETCGLVMAQRTIIDKDGTRGDRFRKGQDMEFSLAMVVGGDEW
eukprot:GGOE01001674.1.p1 GENE.GGOE01001674.1~~GGOE01001674.1.p1  ORF type:complete len:878 (+),score=288.49 GGOE01001674.1:120-2753(+)